MLKEFPILGPDSQKAHVVSMAFRKLMPEKYGEFHNQLLGGQGRAGEASAIKIALSLGADEAKLREEMKDPAITEAFAKTYELANKLPSPAPLLCGRQRGGVRRARAGSAGRKDRSGEGLRRTPPADLPILDGLNHRLWTAKEASCALSAADYADYRSSGAPG